MITKEEFTEAPAGEKGTEGSIIEYGDAVDTTTLQGSTEVSNAEKKEYLPGPEEDPLFKRAKAIQEARMKLEAQRTKETKCCKAHNKPRDKKKTKAAKKARKKNR